MAQNTDGAAETTGDPMQPRIRTRERVRTAPEDEILPAVPRHLEFLFEERPVLPDESSEHYDRLLRTLVAQVMPTDAIEAIWVKDVVDLLWTAKRYRRWRDRIIAQARQESAAASVLPVLKSGDALGLNPGFLHDARAVELAAGWIKGDQRVGAEFVQKLAQRDLTPADVTAHAFQSRLAEVERVERMIASADNRRDALLREILRKRSTVGNKLRDAAAEVIDAEVSTTAAPAPIRTRE